jgi:hypothetical protein
VPSWQVAPTLIHLLPQLQRDTWVSGKYPHSTPRAILTACCRRLWSARASLPTLHAGGRANNAVASVHPLQTPAPGKLVYLLVASIHCGMCMGSSSQPIHQWQDQGCSSLSASPAHPVLTKPVHLPAAVVSVNAGVVAPSLARWRKAGREAGGAGAILSPTGVNWCRASGTDAFA